ncbi:hypothetical protein AYJ09_01585 [Candidatus Liberibacter solanacearum]|uniref:hypothetical protein n=1 Tax=Candidatus Liberibacter solanacearum TaxID=556287 RepID=UPI000978F0A6|nr:hypothetical protein [Candidatus Liberibacter solanacearum]ONI59098.1 hypothetical protein AYJ09_01585 [Candidatus Liberibacter solanacearum]
MYEYESTMREIDISSAELKRLLLLEAQFLPTRNKLMVFLKKAKPVEKLSSLEAYVELDYLTKICLHHQKWYYRLSDPQIEDWIYDQLENRAKNILDIHPQCDNPKHPMNLVGC